MDDLFNRMLYHPLVALPAVYLTSVMSDVDFSLGRALLMVACVSGHWLIRSIINRNYGNNGMPPAGTCNRSRQMTRPVGWSQGTCSERGPRAGHLDTRGLIKSR